jgi:hypothetical protein
LPILAFKALAATMTQVTGVTSTRAVMMPRTATSTTVRSTSRMRG